MRENDKCDKCCKKKKERKKKRNEINKRVAMYFILQSAFNEHFKETKIIF